VNYRLALVTVHTQLLHLSPPFTGTVRPPESSYIISALAANSRL
jgi:hypothetical protein